MILASASPRRKEILSRLSDNFRVVSPDFDERSVDQALFSPSEYVKILSRNKALSVKAQYLEEIVIGADTVVVLDETIYGKPNDDNHAYKMLLSLSGKTHQVLTGVTLCYKDNIRTDYEVSHVTFKVLTDKEIWDYIYTKEPNDKAGAYAIQGIGNNLVLSYEGDFDNIVGLPLALVKNLLAKIK